MADWYYARGGTHQGPVSPAQLKQMAQSGELKPDDLVFQEGGSQWVPASTVKGLFPSGGGKGDRSAVSSKSDPDRERDRDRSRDRERDRERDEDEPRPAPPPQSGPKSSYWVDMLLFRRMIAPTIIMIMFWIQVIGVVLSTVGGLIAGLIAMFNGNALGGLGIMVLSVLFLPVGLLIVRLYCELLILLFRINESIMDIKEHLQRNEDKG